MPEFLETNSILSRFKRGPQLALPKLGGFAPTAPQPTEPDPGLLGSLGNAALSGLSMVGNVLSLPGSSAMDLLVGQNPLDQWLDPLGNTGRLSEGGKLGGRELLRQYGLAGPEDTYGNWWGGFAAEVLTDPLTYATFGASAATKAGQVAKAAGYLDDAGRAVGAAGNLSGRLTGSLDSLIQYGGRDAQQAISDAATRFGVNLTPDLLSQPLGSLGKLEIPFTGIGMNIGTGPGAVRAAQALDRVGGWIGNTAPARFGKMLFDSSVMGTFQPEEQAAARELFGRMSRAKTQAREAAARVVQPMRAARSAFDQAFFGDTAVRSQTAIPGAVFPTNETSEAFIHATGELPRVNTSQQMQAIEITDQAALPDKVQADAAETIFDRFFKMVRQTDGDVEEAMRTFQLDPAKLTPELRQQMTELHKDMRLAAFDIHGRDIIRGGKGGFLETFQRQGSAPAFVHAEQYGANRPQAGLEGIRKAFQTRRKSSFARTPETETIYQEILERINADPLARNPKDLDAAAQHITSKYGNYLGRGADAQGNAWPDRLTHAKEVAKWVLGHSPGQEIYEIDNLKTFSQYAVDGALKIATKDAIHEIVKRNMLGRPGNADLTRPIGQWADEPLVFLEDAYRAADMDTERSLAWLSQQAGMDVDDLKQMAIPLEVSKAITATSKLQTNKEWFGLMGGVMDWLNARFKQAVTLPFPSFWVRNLTSGQWMNMVSGEIEHVGDVGAYAGFLQEGWGLARNGIKDQNLERELLTHSVIDARNLFEDVPMPGTSRGLGNLTPENPLAIGQTWQQAGQFGAENPAMIGMVPGGEAARRGYNTVLGTGAKAAQQVEFMNRVPMYLYLTRHKGYSPAAAAAKVRQLQVDYSSAAFTPFENQVATRLIPFYKFQRSIAPVMTKALADRPGGALAQTIRISNTASEHDASTPDYVTETLAIPNPFKTPTDGTQSYWTGAGLPFEQHMQYVGWPRTALREGLAQLNPVVKAPLEWATNQSFFQRGPGGAGRPLDELDPTLGRTASNLGYWLGLNDKDAPPVRTPAGLEFLVSNSPLTRLATSARQVSDPHKSAIDRVLNAFTGVRVTDVRPAAQDAVLRERSQELMDQLGARDFVKAYFPADVLAAMSPEERAAADRLTQLQTILAKNAKLRKLKKASPVTGQP